LLQLASPSPCITKPAPNQSTGNARWLTSSWLALTTHRTPDTICAVVAEDRGINAWDCQFSFMCDGRPERPTGAAWATAQAVAAEAMIGPAMVHATHYHTIDVSPIWRHDLTIVGKIGLHVFYTDGRCILEMGCSVRPKMRPSGEL